MNRWTISHGKDGFAVELYRYGWRQVAAWAVEGAVDRGCGLTGHLLCGCSSERLWRIPVWTARYDMEDPDDPFLENSIAGVVNSAFNSVMGWTYRVTEPSKIATVSVSDEVGNLLWPGYAEMWGDFDEVEDE